MPAPLQGMRVIELSTWGVGPLAGIMLRDLGAEVIKVEEPRMGDPSRHLKRMVGVVDCELPHGRNAFFEALNRGKLGITLDLKQPRAREVVYRLVKDADVFLENFRPGVADRLGLGYETLSAINPRLVYGSGSGYGPKGPERHRPGLDYVGQARSGLMWIMGHPGDPPVWTTAAFADMMAGVMLGYGIVTALAARGKYGLGQKVDISHLSSTLWLQYWTASVAYLKGLDDVPRFDRKRAGNPMWNHYRCADGEWLALALIQPERFGHDFCEAIGRQDLEHDPRFADEESRYANAAELVVILEEVFATRTRSEWEAILSRYPDFLYERIQRVTDLPNDPQFIANQYLRDYEHPVLGPVTFVNSPFHFSATPTQPPDRPAPELGEHTIEVLQRVAGYSEEEVAQLAVEGVF